LVNQKYYPLCNIKNSQPVLCVENLFTADELHKLLAQLKQISIIPAFVGDEFDTNATNKIRKSNVCFIEDVSFNWVYDKLITAVNHVNNTNYNRVLYGIEPLQYTEYDSAYNGFYGVHRDENAIEISNALLRKLSFTMQLTSEHEYTGGELIIHINDTKIIGSKKFGDITFFDSLIPHEVTPVNSGFRKSLVGWVVGPRV
jgi:predicted 2-oxoglutarate/Fe(II)-dependent dioxygenase YbiX